MAKRLTNGDDPLLLAIACGANREAAARQTGQSIRTVTRRLSDPEFVRRLHGIRSEMVERATAMMTASAMEAVRTMIELLKSNAPHAVRLGSARSLLELGMRYRENLELIDRVAKLETMLGIQPPSHGE